MKKRGCDNEAASFSFCAIWSYMNVTILFLHLAEQFIHDHGQYFNALFRSIQILIHFRIVQIHNPVVAIN